jgi:hypothetical protein
MFTVTKMAVLLGAKQMFIRDSVDRNFWGLLAIALGSVAPREG